LKQFMKSEHVGHKGPLLVSRNNLVPVAGFWITGAARTIDAFLFFITLGIYGIFTWFRIAKGMQTAGQKFAGIRMVKSNNIKESPGYGQLIGLFFCLLAFNIPGVLFQAFTKRKQGLHHKLCRVMHLEKKHYKALRFVLFYIFVIGIVATLGVVTYLNYAAVIK